MRDEGAMQLIASPRRSHLRPCMLLTVAVVGATALGLMATPAIQTSDGAFAVDGGYTPKPYTDGIVYLGNGCFWERQWAYAVLETDQNGVFRRSRSGVTSIVGYAGGSAHEQVCYHTGNASRDYGPLGHAEVVRVSLDATKVSAQFDALAADFFASFVGPAGRRSRPDAGDRGTPYRSVVGLPGGTKSPLYEVLVRHNHAWRMDLKPGRGGLLDADEPNTVWIIDSASYPFYAAEVYHQFHCNFFDSPGMPYPDWYTVGLWEHQKQAGIIKPTGCPESGQHSPCSTGGWPLGRQ